MCNQQQPPNPAKDSLLGALREKTKMPQKREPKKPSLKDLKVISGETDDTTAPVKQRGRRNGSRKRDSNTQELIAIGIKEHDENQAEARATAEANPTTKKPAEKPCLEPPKAKTSITPISSGKKEAEAKKDQEKTRPRIKTKPAEKDPDKKPCLEAPKTKASITPINSGKKEANQDDDEDFKTLKELITLDHHFSLRRFTRHYSVNLSIRAFDLLEGDGEWVEFSEDTWFGQNGQEAMRYKILPIERYREIIGLKKTYNTKKEGSKTKKRKTTD